MCSVLIYQHYLIRLIMMINKFMEIFQDISLYDIFWHQDIDFRFIIIRKKWFLKVVNFSFIKSNLSLFRSSHPEVLLGKGVLKICSKFTGEHPYWRAISLRHGSPVNLLHILGTPFSKNTSRWLLLPIVLPRHLLY